MHAIVPKTTACPISTVGRVEVVPLACRQLAKQFGDVRALDGVDLTVRAGSITGFLGPNGAGKSTLLRIVVGLLRPSAGSASIFGVDARDPTARRRLGSMPADPEFAASLTGRDTLDLLAKLQGSPPLDREWACELLALDPAVLARRAGGYSSGMRQKLAIVQAVQCRPDLVLLDEPANRLDPLAHRGFSDLVQSIAAAGRAVLLSSHTLSEVEVLCHDVVMISQGRVLLAATVAELTDRARRVVTLTHREPIEGLPPEFVPSSSDIDTTVGRIPAHRVDLVERLASHPGVIDILVEPASLEDVFLDLYATPGVDDA